MRVCSESRPPKRRTKYSARQQTIPQTRPKPRTITRIVRFGNEAGRISIGNDTTAAKATFKPIPARKSTRSVLERRPPVKRDQRDSRETTLAQLDRIRANSLTDLRVEGGSRVARASRLRFQFLQLRKSTE